MSQACKECMDDPKNMDDTRQANKWDDKTTAPDNAVIEDIVGYTWKEKSFILQAFTHPSYGDRLS